MCVCVCVPACAAPLNRPHSVRLFRHVIFLSLISDRRVKEHLCGSSCNPGSTEHVYLSLSEQIYTEGQKKLSLFEDLQGFINQPESGNEGRSRDQELRLHSVNPLKNKIM